MEKLGTERSFDNVLSSIVTKPSLMLSGATRIGHGIMSIKDDSVIDVLKKNDVVLEVQLQVEPRIAIRLILTSFPRCVLLVTTSLALCRVLKSILFDASTMLV